MPAGRYFRGLTTFDLLGNLVPGTVLMSGILAVLPTPAVPESPGEYLLFGIVALSAGHFVQHYASLATGDRRSFVRTMKAARQIERPPDEPDTNGDADTGSDTVSDGGEPTVILLIVDAFLDPLVWMFREPRGRVLDEKVLANLAWKHLFASYGISDETENFSVLFHLISSELDDVDAPSRALRFQAIRNFHRGMWIATWLTAFVWSVLLVADNWLRLGSTVLGVEYPKPTLLALSFPAWLLLLLVGVAALGFRRLADIYEEEFIEYLFTDVLVAANESGRRVGTGEEPSGQSADQGRD